VIITSREKDVASYLLDSYGFEHINLGRSGGTLFSLGKELFLRCMRLYRVVRRERPDVMTAIAGTFVAPVGRLTGIPVVTFTDTEHAGISNGIAFPLSRAVVVPSCYRGPAGRRFIRYDGYHELAYLHPDYFTPDPSVLDSLGVAGGERYVILRFVAWESAHDIGRSGISPGMKRRAVDSFSPFARVFISSEKELPPDLEEYRIPIPPEKMHDALYYAALLYGESATMASECAVLGTPAIFIDDAGRGYTEEQERVYGAVFNFTGSPGDQEKSILKGVEILKTENTVALWRGKRERILRDKIDVTRFVTELVESFGS